MSKRFIDTTIWTQNKWFRKMKVEYKLLWFYILSTCDNVGVWEEDLELASFIIGYTYSIDSLLIEYKNQIKKISDKKYWIIDFCNFQYGELKEENKANKPHQSYINLLKKHSLWKDYIKSIHSHKEKEKDKDKEKDYKSEFNFIEVFNSITGKNIKVFDDKAKRQFTARLKEGFTTDDIEKAITNCMNDSYHKENPKFLTPEFITRADKLQKFLNIDSQPQKIVKELNYGQK